MNVKSSVQSSTLSKRNIQHLLTQRAHSKTSKVAAMQKDVKPAYELPDAQHPSYVL